MDPDEVFGGTPDEYARQVRAFNEQQWPRPMAQDWEGGGVSAPLEQAPMPRRIDEVGRGQQLDELQTRLGQYVQEGRMPASYARQVMQAHERDAGLFGDQAAAGPGVDVGGLTPAQAVERVRSAQAARPSQVIAAEQQVSPEEQALLGAQRAVANARLGPGDRVRMQELANSLRQIQEGVRNQTLYPVDAHRMWTEVYPELQRLQARQAQVPVLEARLASIQLQHQHAVASTVDQQRQAFAAANAQSRVYTARLENGTVVQLMKDDNGRFHALHGEPIQAIPPGFRNEAEIARTIQQRQQTFWNQNVAGVPGAAHNWQNRAAQIEHDVRTEANRHRVLAQQASREQRLGEGGSQQQRHEEDRYHRAYEHEAAAVDREIAAYLKPKPATQTDENKPRPWMVGPNTRIANPHARRDEEIRRRLAERGIQQPGQAAGQAAPPPNQAAFDALMQRLLTLPRR